MRKRETCLLLFPVMLGFFLAVSVAGDEAVGRERGEVGERISVSEDLVDERSADLRRRIDDIASTQGDLEEAQAVVDIGESRVRELGERRSDLTKRLELATERRKTAKVRYEETVRSAYRGSGIQGVELFLDSILGGGDVGIDPALTQAILSDAEALNDYREAEAYLEESRRQVDETDSAYEEAIAGKEQGAQKLRDRIRTMQESAADMRAEIQTTRRDISRLEEAERRRILRERAATISSPNGISSPSGTAEIPETAVDEYAAVAQYESEISQDGIYIEEVVPIGDESYIRLYQESAAQYGFADDWHILAAIGMVESGHGQNLGPSSAGAMGPMQFLPSTWAFSGVDGNGDGVANIMDPEDAIPAAASYLKAGGAPGDWYAAIFSYNHADWYVQEVLAVSDGYRQLEEQEGRPTL